MCYICTILPPPLTIGKIVGAYCYFEYSMYVQYYVMLVNCKIGPQNRHHHHHHHHHHSPSNWIKQGRDLIWNEKKEKKKKKRVSSRGKDDEGRSGRWWGGGKGFWSYLPVSLSLNQEGDFELNSMVTAGGWSSRERKKNKIKQGGVVVWLSGGLGFFFFLSARLGFRLFTKLHSILDHTPSYYVNHTPWRIGVWLSKMAQSTSY